MKPITKQTYALFRSHLRRYRGLVFIILSSLLAAVITGVIAPLYYRRFFDILSVSELGSAEVVAELTHIIIFVLALAGIEWFLSRIAAFCQQYLSARVMADLSNTAFAYLHQHSYSFFVNRFVGALVRKVNRLVDAFDGISDRIIWELFPLAVRIAAILLVLFYRNIEIALIMLGWVIIYTALNYIFILYKLKYDEESAEIDTHVTARLADTVTNTTTIKLFTAFTYEARWFRELVEKQFRIRKFAWNLEEYLMSFQSGLMIFLEFGIFYVAIRFWNKGMLTLGDLVLIQAYLIQMFTRLWDFGRAFRSIYKHLADAEEMVEILNTPHEIQDKPGAKELFISKGEIEFRSVSFTYTKTREVIRNFSVRIAPGEKIGLVGPSGAGKSTLFALLLRFYDLQDGVISIDDENIADVTQDSLRRHIAMVPQDPILFHRSLMENIRYGRREASDEEVMEAAKLAHCDEFIEKLPQGYDTFVGERGIKLSGGERQRVAIARAILKNAPILLLDEATSSLDSHSEAMIQDALTTLMQGKTVIVIAHRLSTIMKMDRIVVMREGEIAEIGTHQELVEKDEGLYKGLWELQAGGFIG